MGDEQKEINKVWPAQLITSNERTQMTDCSYNRLLRCPHTYTHLRTQYKYKKTHPTPVCYCVEHPEWEALFKSLWCYSGVSCPPRQLQHCFDLCAAFRIKSECWLSCARVVKQNQRASRMAQCRVQALLQKKKKATNYSVGKLSACERTIKETRWINARHQNINSRLWGQLEKTQTRKKMIFNFLCLIVFVTMGLLWRRWSLQHPH